MASGLDGMMSSLGNFVNLTWEHLEDREGIREAIPIL